MRYFKPFLLVGLLFSSTAQAGCFWFTWVLEKDEWILTHVSACSDSGSGGSGVVPSSFEPRVIDRILQQVQKGGGRATKMAILEESRTLLWRDASGNARRCIVPDITSRGELQPLRTATAARTYATFSTERLPPALKTACRLAANGWNRALAVEGRKTRFIEVPDAADADIVMAYRDLVQLYGDRVNNTMAVTARSRRTITAAGPMARSHVILNTRYAADWAATPMMAAQVCGHELGHTLGLADVRGGSQLMSGAVQYTTEDEVHTALGPDEYEPNICEIAKLGDNGLP